MTASGDIGYDVLFNDLAARPLGSAKTEIKPGDELRARIGLRESIDLERELADYERTLMEAALTVTDDNLTEAAKLLGISFRQIRYKVRQLGLR